MRMKYNRLGRELKRQFIPSTFILPLDYEQEFERYRTRQRPGARFAPS